MNVTNHIIIDHPKNRLTIKIGIKYLDLLLYAIKDGIKYIIITNKGKAKNNTKGTMKKTVEPIKIIINAIKRSERSKIEISIKIYYHFKY